jgi:hypothetical protein
MSDELREYQLEDGSKVKLGNIAPPAGLVSSWPVYGKVPNTPIIPRDEWVGLIDAAGQGPEVGWKLPYVHDQQDVGMCNCSATASAMESARFKQGLPVRKLSAGDLYRRICFNGRDSGSLLEDGIRVAMAEGIATVDTCPYMDWKNDRAGAAEERKQNRVLEAFLCPTFDACMSAVLSGFDLISGIMWYDSYFKPGADGWLPAPSGGAGGHALHSYKATYKMSTFGTTFGIWTKNSWKPSWGLNGFCVIPEKAFAGQVSGWWAVRAVTDEGGVVPQEQN